MKTRSKSRPFSSALLLIFLVAAWVMLAPAQLGGRASYVIVNGASMEPSMHKGDLAIVHSEEEYQSGDVVTYRDPRMGPVIHRIIEVSGNSFVLQGDNNSWIDSYKPTQPELIGKLWIHIPSAGKFISIVQSPLNMALFMGVSTMISLSLLAPRKDKAKKALQRQSVNRRQTPGLLGETGQAVLTVLVAVLFGALLLAFLSYTRTTSRTVSDDLAYQHTGAFEYSAAVPAGIYDTDRVATGQPVFRKLTDAVTVGFKYRLQSDQPRDIRGTYRLNAEVRDSSGWKRTIPLSSETGFKGDSFTASGTLDLVKVQVLIDGIEARTGIERADYTLSIAPEVTTRGELAGQTLEDNFAPRLDFRLDPLQLQLLSSAGEEGSAILQPSQQGLMKRSRTEPNTISLPFLDLGVTTARWMSLIGLVFSVVGLLVLGLLTLRTLRGGEPSRIQSRYARMLVDVHAASAGLGGHIVEVTQFEDLVKIAGKDGRMILHDTDGDTDRYYLQDGDVTYLYRADAGDSETGILKGELA
ncbi:MAG: signal peptidase I [Chloroflexota bacterium]|nr:signal peptidase I [Chloroflexota bacterium]